MPELTAAAVRAVLARPGAASLKSLKASLAADPAATARLWSKLTPLERAACWRLLPASAVPAAAARLTPEQAWEAYQAADVACLAPLLDAAPKARGAFRASSRAEATLLRARALAA